MPTWASRALGPLNMPVKPHSLQVLQNLALVRADQDQSEVPLMPAEFKHMPRKP